MHNISNYQKTIIAALLRENVAFIVIGGKAVQFYNPHRNTEDVDILISREQSNIQQLIAALKSLMTIQEDFLSDNLQKPYKQISLPCKTIKEVDILTSLGGLDFCLAIENTITIEIEGLSIPILGLEELIYSKFCAASKTEDPNSLEKDLEDIDKLISVWSLKLDEKAF
jgi:predicted nucleotidyltransferase